MVAILCIIFATYLSALTPLVFEACDQLVPVVFGIDQILGQYISMATATMYNVGVSLMILKFLKKGYEIYVMGTDGDPDMDPLQLVTNFIKAMVVAVGFIYPVWLDNRKAMVGRLRTEAEATADYRRAYITRTCGFHFSADTYHNRTCSRDIRYFCYSSTDY